MHAYLHENPYGQQAKKNPNRIRDFTVWWTRRELNPRPKAISGQDYMLSSLI
jgi:hypothetical protein